MQHANVFFILSFPYIQSSWLNYLLKSKFCLLPHNLRVLWLSFAQRILLVQTLSFMLIVSFVCWSKKACVCQCTCHGPHCFSHIHNSLFQVSTIFLSLIRLSLLPLVSHTRVLILKDVFVVYPSCVLVNPWNKVFVNAAGKCQWWRFNTYLIIHVFYLGYAEACALARFWFSATKKHMNPR